MQPLRARGGLNQAPMETKYNPSKTGQQNTQQRRVTPKWQQLAVKEASSTQLHQKEENAYGSSNGNWTILYISKSLHTTD